MPFHSTGPHYCPDCPPVVNKKDRRIDPPLKLVESNYSGCGVDIAECERCGKAFQIEYQVKSIQSHGPGAHRSIQRTPGVRQLDAVAPTRKK